MVSLKPGWGPLVRHCDATSVGRSGRRRRGFAALDGWWGPGPAALRQRPDTDLCRQLRRYFGRRLHRESDMLCLLDQSQRRREVIDADSCGFRTILLSKCGEN
jgi:hypothetical protein